MSTTPQAEHRPERDPQVVAQLSAEERKLLKRIDVQGATRRQLPRLLRQMLSTPFITW